MHNGPARAERRPGKRPRRRFAVAALAASAFVCGSAPAPADSLPTLDQLRYLTEDEAAARRRASDDPDGYGWDLFLYANWRALSGPDNRGRPDPALPIGRPGGPVTWQTWKSDAEVFLDRGAEPAKWATAEPVPPDLPPPVGIPTPTSGAAHWERMTGNTQVDGFDLKGPDGTEVLYEIRQNRSTFRYIRDNGLYFIEGQIAFGQDYGDFDFEWTAMEAKAAWIWLDPERDADRIPHYFTVKGYYAERNKDGSFAGWKTGLLGLTGLHLITKAREQWVWVTFEQVENEAWTGVTRRDPIPPQVEALNRKMRGLLTGTWLANYELVGVQIDWGTAADPTILANTQIETLFQSRSSCMTCHWIASVGRKPVRPEDTLRMSYLDPNGVYPPYYVGPGPSLGSFKSMDFLWSLDRAQWRQP